MSTFVSCSNQSLLGTLTGKEIEIDIDPNDKIERVKEKVEEKEGTQGPVLRHRSVQVFGVYPRHF